MLESKPPTGTSKTKQLNLIFFCFGCPSGWLALPAWRFLYHVIVNCKGPISVQKWWWNGPIIPNFLQQPERMWHAKVSESKRVWKAKWCKIQETNLASRSTNLLSRSRQISLKLNKINSCSTDFLSRSRLRFELTKITSPLSRNYLSRARDIWVKLRERRTRGSHDFKFIVPKGHKDIFRFSFFPRTITEWNKLPQKTVSSQSLCIFKGKLN